jgi:hypothetical protein
VNREETVNDQWECSGCKQEITDEQEYYDNDGVCDDCYSIPVRKRRGLIMN